MRSLEQDAFVFHSSCGEGAGLGLESGIDLNPGGSCIKNDAGALIQGTIRKLCRELYRATKGNIQKLYKEPHSIYIGHCTGATRNQTKRNHAGAI